MAQATVRIRVVLGRDLRVVPMRRRPVFALSRSGWECARCPRFRGRSICVGVLLARRDAPGPMDGDVLAGLLVLAHAQTQALPGPGAAGSEPQRLSDPAAEYRLKVTRHGADQRPARNGPARCADADTGLCRRPSARRSRYAAAARVRRIRLDEQTTGPQRRPCENCERRTIERHGNESGAAAGGNLRAAGGHPDR
jgi:hypothetical protein